MATWIVFDNRAADPASADQRWIVRAGLASLAAAQAVAATDEHWTAYHSAVSDDAEPGLLIDILGAGAGSISASLTIEAEVRRRRAAAWTVHTALQGWSAALAVEGVAHDWATVGVGHNFLRRAHEAAYIMGHRTLLPVAQYEDWCTQMARGASDVTSPHTFFRRMEAGGGLAAPAGPCAWVRWGHTAGEGLTTAVRVPLADAVAASGPITVQAPGNLNLLSADLPRDGLTADGSWIDADIA